MTLSTVSFHTTSAESRQVHRAQSSQSVEALGQTAPTETIKSQIGKRGGHTWTVVPRV